MSKENEKTLEVYKEKAYLYLSNSIEHDKLDPERAKQKREKLEKLITSNFSNWFWRWIKRKIYSKFRF